MGKRWGLAPLFAAAVIACSSSKASPSLTGTDWIYASSSGVGTGLVLKSDGSYLLSELALTSDTSANVESEEGSYTISGNTISFTPKEWSCEEKSEAPYTATFSQSGDTLDVAFSSGVTSFQVDASSGAGFSDTFGCFLNDGTFVASPLEPLGSCASPGDSCAGTAVCCEGNVCVQQGTQEFCAGSCTTGSDCESGCCTPLSNSATLFAGFCSACPDAGP